MEKKVEDKAEEKAEAKAEEAKAEEAKEDLSTAETSKEVKSHVIDLDILERRLKDEQATKKQLKTGVCPNIRTTLHPVNMKQILEQLRLKTKYKEVVRVNTKMVKPDHRNLRLIDPFM